MKLYKLNARGVAHIIAPLVVIVTVGAIGSYLYVSGHAATGNSGPIVGIASKCIDNYANQKVNFNKVQLYTCNGTGAQQWTVNSNGTITNANDDCLDVYAAGTAPSTVVDLYQCNGTAAQQWVVNAAKKTIINPHSGLCLDDRAANTADSTQIQIYTCNGTNAQGWVATTSSGTPAGSGGTGSTGGGSNGGGSITTTSSIAPVVVGHELEQGNTGKQLKMDGVAVWGIQDSITGSFGVNEYNNRQTVISTVKSWGSNVIRLRVEASDYESQKNMSKVQYIQEIKDWQSAAQNAGLYLQITWWDSLDGTYSGANWANDYSQVFPMMNDVVGAMGVTNPWVIYEPFNEPNNVSGSQWLSAMEATAHEFRSTLGYKGILLIDTYDWAHAYDDTNMTALENYDASQSGMNGKNQIIFAKHDYANEGYANPDSSFQSSYWASNDSGTSTWNFSKHLVWETEFGNYNGSPSTVHLAWAGGAATWMAQQVNNGTLVGADAFLFGPWYDANAMTSSDNVTPTQWGSYVKNNFLSQVTH